MLDRFIIPLTEKILEPLGPRLFQAGLSPERLLIMGFIAGLGAALAAGSGSYYLALGLFIFNRLLDGLGESSGRAGGITKVGRYLEISLGLVVYGAIALSFAFSGDGNALIAAILIFSLFIWAGASLAYAGVARGLKMQKDVSGVYLLDLGAGLIGTTEMALGMIFLLLVPEFFAAIAILLSGFLLVNTVFRVIKAKLVFQE